jgi:thermitase
MKFLPFLLSAGFASLPLSAAKIVVRTTNPQALAPHCLSITPLVSYPGAREDTKYEFRDYYVIEQAESCTPPFLSGAAVVSTASSGGSVGPLVESPPPLFAPAPDSSWGGAYHPNDQWFSLQWDRSITRIDWAWNVTRGSHDVIVAILDTGVDTTHPDLEANLSPGYNLVDTSLTVQDGHGHGTAVSGVVAASIDNSICIAGISQSSLMPVKVVADNGYYENADLVRGILYARDHGARVINMSLGGDQDTLIEQALDYAWKKGCFICAAAGNFGADSSLYPAAYGHVMSVGYTNSQDERDPGSHYGRNVDIFAPGTQILSTSLGGGSSAFTGSSLASPEIAGLAALILSVNPGYTNEQVADLIFESADSIETDVGRVPRMSAGLFASSAPSVQRDTLKFNYTSSKYTTYTLTFYDAAGRKVAESHGSTAELGRIDFKPSLSSGVYFWVMRTPYGSSAGKVCYFK